jgi:hypothetical protein
MTTLIVVTVRRTYASTVPLVASRTVVASDAGRPGWFLFVADWWRDRIRSSEAVGINSTTGLAWS